MSPTAPVFATTGRLGSSGTWEVPFPTHCRGAVTMSGVPIIDPTRTC